MASIQDLQNDIYRYANLKDKLNKVARELEYAAQKEGAASNLVASEFKINNESAKISERGQAVKSDIDGTVNYIRNTVIPAIDEATTTARRNIAYLEEQERQRREAEERRQREEEQRREEEARQEEQRREEERKKREQESKKKK